MRLVDEDGTPYRVTLGDGHGFSRDYAGNEDFWRTCVEHGWRGEARSQRSLSIKARWHYLIRHRRIL